MLYLALLINEDKLQDNAKSSGNEKLFVNISAVLLVVMTGFTMYKIYTRWALANSEQTVQPPQP
jgi:hypothetical protein